MAKHVKQMELTERKWGDKLKEVRKKQKRAYKRAIVRWATEGLPKNITNDVIHEYKAAKKKKKGNPSPKSSPVGRVKSDGQLNSPGVGRNEPKRKKSWWGKKGDSNEG